MIVADLPGGGLRLVRQPDHAEQCAQFAREWGNEGFARFAPWGALVRATSIHDDGWGPLDDRPEVGDDGRPIDFPHLDRRRHIDLYRAGIEAAVAVGPRVGLVVSLHGQGLYEKRMGLDGPRPDRATRPEHERRFIDDQERLQQRLRTDLPANGLAGWEWAAYRLLQAWDVLSLYICWGGLDRGETWSLWQVPRGVGDEGVTLRLAPLGDAAMSVDPWPFRDAEVVSPVRAVRIPAGPYPHHEALRAAVDAAEPWWHTVVLRAG